MIPKFRVVKNDYQECIDNDVKVNIYEVDCIDFDAEMVKAVTDDPDDWLSFGSLEFLQSTGLFDKNGKEIYEGDIIAYQGGSPFAINGLLLRPQYSFIIEWLDDSGTVHLHDFWFGDVDSPITKIIGNKFENPELLEGK